jgi:alpha-mannosidase/mannosylglycerate hydrolase
VEVEATVHNTASDHRLRVLLPSGARADTYLADSPFDVLERPIGLRADNHLYRELEVEAKPQQSWTAVHDDVRGLALVAPGQLETAVRDLPERPIALTLLRATRRTVMTDGEPLGQMQGPLTFRYAIVPLQRPPDRVTLTELGQRIAAGLRAVSLGPKDLALQGVIAERPLSGSLMELEGRAVLTSARLVGGALEVRLFNPEAEAIQALLRVPGTLAQAQHVDLESQPRGEAQPIAEGCVPLELRPKEIVTLRLS